jgi:hypothetical protein
MMPFTKPISVINKRFALAGLHANENWLGITQLVILFYFAIGEALFLRSARAKKNDEKLWRSGKQQCLLV